MCAQKLTCGLLCPQPTTGQLRFLLGWAFADVEAAASRVAAFGLLKAVIGRRLVVPEVYDLMSRVQALMISSHVRMLCMLRSSPHPRLLHALHLISLARAAHALNRTICMHACILCSMVALHDEP